MSVAAPRRAPGVTQRTKLLSADVCISASTAHWPRLVVCEWLSWGSGEGLITRTERYGCVLAR